MRGAVYLLICLFGFAASSQAMPDLSTSLSASLQNDVNGNGDANPGDTLEYELQIQNLGSQDATSATISSFNDPNTTYVPGTFNVLPFAVADTATVVEDASPNTVSVNVLGNDAGEDTGETLTVTGVSGNLVPGMIVGSYGILSWASNGVFSYALDNSNTTVQALNDGQTLTESFNYTIADGTGETDTDTLSVVIQGVDDPLSAADDSYDAYRNAEITVDATSGVLGNDVGAGLFVSASDTTSAKGGAVSVATDGSFTYSINSLALTETDTFSYTVTDGFGNSDTGTVTLTAIGRIFYVDNTGFMGGSGTFADPFADLSDAFTVANETNDIIYVAEGDGTSTNYEGTYSPAANNICLVGSGVDLEINGVVQIASTNHPLLGAPDTALMITNMSFETRGFEIAPFTSPSGSVFSIEAEANDGGTHQVEVKEYRSMTSGSDGFLHGFSSGSSTLRLLGSNIVVNGVADSCILADTLSTAMIDLDLDSLLCSSNSREGLYAFAAGDSTQEITIVNSTFNSNITAGAFIEVVNNAQATVNFEGGNLVQNHSGTFEVGINLIDGSTNTITLNITPTNGTNNSVTNNEIGVCNDAGFSTVNVNPASQVSGNAMNFLTSCPGN